MWLDLIDSLRCPNDHDETPLVCVAYQSSDRDLEDGVLGCPQCRAQFRVRDAVAWFGETPGDVRQAIFAVAGDDDGSLALRVAALLDLSTPGGVVAFSAGAAASAADVAARVDVHALVVNVAAARPGLVSAICGVRTLPLAAGSLRGAVLDAPDAGFLESFARAVRVGGRLIAPAAWTLPVDYRELARDERQWVAEHESARSRPVPLRVAR
jgi:uncharacterized protein YbaR (Trm112 family)